MTDLISSRYIQLIGGMHISKVDIRASSGGSYLRSIKKPNWLSWVIECGLTADKWLEHCG
ncbi:hypothetical protein VIBNISFn118_1320022 [Vibrio nigripulchritudo SFn118]|nr:hypothetical protein VIBNISFn118_1320022 [Vibrio nigripulchritudo SFn118]